jgi:hypothetical protein
MNEAEQLAELARAAQDAIAAYDKALTKAGKHFDHGPDTNSVQALREAAFQIAYVSGSLECIDDFDPCEMFDDARPEPDL